MSEGLYVIPDSIAMDLLHGIYFARKGRYQDGIFRFVVAVHPNYPGPRAEPLVVFLDDVYHPFVHRSVRLVPSKMITLLTW
jgi:ubiquitin-protein ligase